MSSAPQTHYGSLSSDDSSALATPYPDSEFDPARLVKQDDFVSEQGMNMTLLYDEPHKALHLQPREAPTHRYGLGDFVFHRTLGTGSFGRVHLGWQRASASWAPF